jgi:hypothetical protein
MAVFAPSFPPTVSTFLGEHFLRFTAAAIRPRQVPNIPKLAKVPAKSANG